MFYWKLIIAFEPIFSLEYSWLNYIYDAVEFREFVLNRSTRENYLYWYFKFSKGFPQLGLGVFSFVAFIDDKYVWFELFGLHMVSVRSEVVSAHDSDVEVVTHQVCTRLTQIVVTLCFALVSILFVTTVELAFDFGFNLGAPMAVTKIVFLFFMPTICHFVTMLTMSFVSHHAY